MRILCKAIGLTGILASFAAGSAQAEIISYSWHQTSASIPGLHFQGNYVIDTSFGPTDTDSSSSPIDFGGLISLSISGAGPELSLDDLQPGCDDPGTCSYLDWNLYVSGPYISLNFTNEFFDYHVEDVFRADTDQPGLCDQTGACVADGYWANDAPEPATLALLLGGLVLVGKGRRKQMKTIAV